MIDIIVDGVVLEPGELWGGITGFSGATALDNTVKVNQPGAVSRLIQAKEKMVNYYLGKVDDFFSAQ